MSSRFIAAGGEEVKAPEGLSAVQDDAWAKARKQVEEARKPHVREGPAPGVQADGKSLYEHLQAQKAAKQEAFEEASKLRNQFRPLDDNEVDFLESVKRKERLEAADVQKQTAEQLEAFRKEQTAAEQLALEIAEKQEADKLPEVEASVWTTAKKRRRGQQDENLAGVKARKLSPIPAADMRMPSQDKESLSNEAGATVKEDTTLSKDALSKADKELNKKPGLGLLAYDSDSDD